MRESEAATASAVRSSATGPILASLGLVAATAAVLLAMGRVPWCACGTVRLWYGDVQGSENSQQITDWYTPSHLIHGFLFYGILWLVGRLAGRQLPMALRFALATGVECAWEIAENTPTVIAHYRAATIAAGYHGDSVLNSLSDIAAMAVGFALAANLPVAVTVILGIAMEVVVGIAIRDNLTLNVLMLIHTFPAIKAWQAGT